MKTLGGSKRTNWAIFIALVLLSLVFHSYNLSYASYDLDEAVHIWHAQKSYSDVLEQSSHDPNPPVYNLILSAWVKTFGVSEWATRFLSVLFGAIAVGLMFLFASRNFGLAVGIMAALFFCFSPILFRFTHLARPYTLLMLTVIASYGSLFEYFRTSRKDRLILYYLFTTLMIYVHPTSIFNLPGQGILILITYWHNFRQVLSSASVAVASVVTFAAYYLMIPYFDQGVEMWFVAPDIEAVWRVIEVFYGNSTIICLQLLLLTIIAFRFLKNSETINWNYLLVAAIWFLLPIISSVVFSHLFMPVFQDKYVMSAHSGLILLLAVSIHKAFNGYWRLIPFTAVLALVITPIKTRPDSGGDWRGVVAHINANYDENTCIFIHPWYEFRTFSYYFDRNAYLNPSLTQKYLVENRVYTAWHDVLPDGPYGSVSKMFLITSNGDYVGLPFTMDSVNRVSELLETKNFSSLKLSKYQWKQPALESYLDTVASETMVGVGVVGVDDSYSKAIVIPLETEKP